MYRSQDDETLVDQRCCHITNAETPQTPSEIPRHNVVTERRVVLFNIGWWNGVSKVFKDFGCTTVDTEQTTKAVGISKCPIRNNSDVQCPQEKHWVVAIDCASELVTETENGSVVDKHEHANNGQDFCFIIISQQPPLGEIGSIAVKFITTEPSYREYVVSIMSACNTCDISNTYFLDRAYRMHSTSRSN